MENLQYTGEFELFYALPLNAEAQACEVGVGMVVDRAALRAGSGVARLARVLDVQDEDGGRHVKFKEVVNDDTETS